MVPDASAEKPMIIDNEKDQPLCKPQKLLKPKKSLQAMKGYEYFVLTNEILKPRKIVIDKANHILVISHNNGVYSVRMDECGNADIKQILGNDMTDLPVGDGTVEGAIASGEARRDLTRAMRSQRRAKIKEDNFLKAMPRRINIVVVVHNNLNIKIIKIIIIIIIGLISIIEIIIGIIILNNSLKVNR